MNHGSPAPTSLAAVAGKYADLIGALVALFRTEADPVSVADHLLVEAIAACQELRAARETEQRKRRQS